MNAGFSQAGPLLEWAWAGRALDEGQEGGESGDLHLVAPFAGGTLVAVIDGLGHGPEAAKAAAAAAEILAANAGSPVVQLVEMCHERLRKTRGAVMSLASFCANDSSVTWIGVGNVEGLLVRESESEMPHLRGIVLRAGVVGYRLPPLRPATIAVEKGNTLIIATDGIRSGFVSDLRLTGNLQHTANWILTHHAIQSDDALVVVARYLGDAP
jgi:phosphoserine phosphatase RsbX